MVLMRWMCLLLLHQLVFATESLKSGSFLIYFTEGLMQLILDYHVEQDEYCIINMRNLKVKVTLNLKVFKVVWTKARSTLCAKSWAYFGFILNKNTYARRRLPLYQRTSCRLVKTNLGYAGSLTISVYTGSKEYKSFKSWMSSEIY